MRETRRVLMVVGGALVLGGALACATLQPAPAPEATPGAGPTPDRVVHIVAERFLFTPAQITVEAGTTLEIRLTSQDTDHGFRIVGHDEVDVIIPKRGRGEAKAVFEATEPGEFRFECSHICGAGHSYMSGVIRVTASPAAQTDGGSR